MSHFAHINSSNIVDQVIVAEPELIQSLSDSDKWIQTSYNTRGGVHYNPNTGIPDNGVPLRKNYAAIGHYYDFVRDAFIPPQPFPSWNLNEETCLWESPTPYPKDGKQYFWSESSLEWLLFISK